ncbi:hypothetical protein IWX49DRAFT_351619 [Phyllosticta citricarpa]|uniref:Growth-regulating factor n=2 Tax=Phyllosticta TaxID=121621 RepID=A0ABR1LC15_9PEZI
MYISHPTVLCTTATITHLLPSLLTCLPARTHAALSTSQMPKRKHCQAWLSHEGRLCANRVRPGGGDLCTTHLGSGGSSGSRGMGPTTTKKKSAKSGKTTERTQQRNRRHTESSDGDDDEEDDVSLGLAPDVLRMIELNHKNKHHPNNVGDADTNLKADAATGEAQQLGRAAKAQAVRVVKALERMGL